jgi:hypothetical protein
MTYDQRGGPVAVMLLIPRYRRHYAKSAFLASKAKYAFKNTRTKLGMETT